MRTIQRKIAGAFIFSNDDHLLIGKNAKGGVYEDLWVIPGGGIDDRETELQALRREVSEEVGIDVSKATISRIDISLSGSAEKTLRETGETVMVHMSFCNFRVDMPDTAENIETLLQDDLSEAQWVKTSELSAYSFSPSIIETLQLLGFIA